MTRDPFSSLGTLVAALALACAVPAQGVTFNVDRSDDDGGATGCDDAVPNDCSLRGAILAANALTEASTINVPAGAYVLSQVSTCTFSVQPVPTEFFTSSHIPLCLSKQVTIQGAGAATTIIDGGQRVRVLYVSASAVAELRGVTIANGLGDPSFGSPRLVALPISGGGILNEGTLTLTETVVRDNTIDPNAGAASGAGIYNARAASLTLVRSTVTNNVGPGNDLGGGIYTGPQSTLTVIDSTISNNIIAGNGGGILNDQGTVTITGSTISGNTANVAGGGIANFGSNFPALVTITNSTISDNSSGSAGGGIFNGARSTVHLNNVTITNNTGAAADRGIGGGVVNQDLFTLRNSIIAGNRDALGSSPDCEGSLTSQGYNLIQNTTNCVIGGDTTGNLTGVDPKLGVLTNNGGFTQTHGLSDGSPAIDAGNPAAPGSGGAACAAADQRGLLRPLGATCDIGAFERSTTLSLAKVLPNTGGNDGSVIALLSGGGFAPEAVALLRRAGHADIAGRPVATETAGAALTTTFDLTGADLGSWDVVVTNPDLASVILPGGFTVETPRAADLFAVVVARSGARPGVPVRFAVFYGNRGNTDALGVPLTLSLPASFARSFSVEVAAPPAQPGQPYNDYRDVPIEVTAGVGSDQVSIPLLIPIVPGGFTGILAFTLTPPGGTNGTEFTVGALIGTPWFANGTVRPDVVAEAATRARQFAADRLGVTAGPELDPALIAYETAALGLAVASSRDDLVNNLGQSRRVFSLAYFAIDLAGYVAAQATASAAPAPLTWLAALPQQLGFLFGLIAGTTEAQTICPPCFCPGTIHPGCSLKPCNAGCGIPDSPPPPKPPPTGLTPGECRDIPKHVVSADGKTCKPGGSVDCPVGPFGAILPGPNCQTYPIKGSWDPNDKAGSGGRGPERFVAAGTAMPYMIAFENLPAATAAAQTVVVTDQLDTGVLDLDSFTLGPILIGNIGITPPPGLATFSGGADLRPAHNVVVRVDAALDKTTGIVRWRFTSLDPSTMETLSDPDEGFLPPNTNPPAGDAQVHFTILPKAGLAAGTQICNQATIVFDVNAPIDTPRWCNTIDDTPPTSHVLPLPATQTTTSFPVAWAGTDDGSGIADFTIYVSEDRGPFTALLSNSTDTSTTFTGQVGKRYAFCSVARDLTGNVEQKNCPSAPDTSTRIAPITSTCTGDCSHDGEVTVDELITGVNMALGTLPLDTCPSFDSDASGEVTINELIAAVNNALNGC